MPDLQQNKWLRYFFANANLRPRMSLATAFAVSSILLPNQVLGLAVLASSEFKSRLAERGRQDPSQVDDDLDQVEPESKDLHAAANNIDELLEVQVKIKEILPRVLPCVVAVDGGTGVIVSSDGLILTASHVAGLSGRTVKVIFSNGRVEEATTLGTNNHTDASAIKLKSAGPWEHLPLIPTVDAEPGSWCLALGYPSAFPRGKSAAVRLGRILKSDDQELMTDCSIMGGDSGGPLINLQGDLIGINSRVKNGMHENFHIPTKVFLKEWDKIAGSSDIRHRSSRTGQRAYLGLHAETDAERVRIRNAHKNSPAEKAGLKPEDVILEFDGKRISSFDEILESVEGRQPGEEIYLIVNRYGQLLKVKIVLGSQY